MERGLRAISPVIATVIILAVTIALAIAVIGWIMGWFSGFTKGSPTLSIEADSHLYNVTSSNTNIASGTYLVLHIRNLGTSDATIYKVEIEGVGPAANMTLKDSFTSTSDLPKLSDMKNTVVLKAGEDKYLIAYFTQKVTPGTMYNIKVYVKGVSTPYTTVLTAEQAKVS